MTIRFEETAQPPSRLLRHRQSSSASSSSSSSAGLRSYRDAALSPRSGENGEKSGATTARMLSAKQPKGSGGERSRSPISIVDRESSSKGQSPSPSPSTTTKRKKSGNGGKIRSRSRRRRSFQPPSVCDDSDTISIVSSSNSSNSSSSDSDSSTNSNSGNGSTTSTAPSTPRAKRIASATSSSPLPKQQQQPKSKRSVHFSTPLVTQIYTRPYTLADDIPILFYSAQDEERFREEYYRDSYNDQSHSEDICGATFDVDLDAIVSDDKDGVISDLTSEEEESEEELNEDTNKKENLPSLEGDNLSFLSLSPPPLQINDNNSKKAKRSKEYVISKAVVIHDGKIQTYYDDDILMIPAPTLDTTTADNSNSEQETLQPFFTTNKTMPVIPNQCGAEAYAETKTAAAATVHHFFDNFDFWNGTVTWY